MQQHKKCQEVIQGTDRADIQHEIPDHPEVPPSGTLRPILVDLIHRDRNLRHVVQKVIQQDLRRQHGQEGQEERGHGHAEHVPEVGTGAHKQVLHHI